jgi:hypothetical protein|eukprot:COSAG06_NODE_729_length_12742_cov_15.795064_3_plen_143_part_00
MAYTWAFVKTGSGPDRQREKELKLKHEWRRSHLCLAQDEHSQSSAYHNTCYFRTDGCHDKSCDPYIRPQGHHESGYLYCEGDETATSQAQLDACDHEEQASAASDNLFIFLLFFSGCVLYSLLKNRALFYQDRLGTDKHRES